MFDRLFPIATIIEVPPWTRYILLGLRAELRGVGHHCSFGALLLVPARITPSFPIVSNGLTTLSPRRVFPYIFRNFTLNTRPLTLSRSSGFGSAGYEGEAYGRPCFSTSTESD